MKYLFVYGSLRPGWKKLHTIPGSATMRRTLRIRARHHGPASVPGVLVDLGRYPGLLPTAGDRIVQGDLYEIADKALLSHLDAYEGCAPGDPLPHEYRRTRTRATLPDGRVVDAWVYEYQPRRRRIKPLSSGDWLNPA